MNKPRFPRTPRQSNSGNFRPSQNDRRPSGRTSGQSAMQKRDAWLAKAAEAQRAGDAVEMELALQHADHWHRVTLGQD